MYQSGLHGIFVRDLAWESTQFLTSIHAQTIFAHLGVLHQMKMCYGSHRINEKKTADWEFQAMGR